MHDSFFHVNYEGNSISTKRNLFIGYVKYTYLIFFSFLLSSLSTVLFSI